MHATSDYLTQTPEFLLYDEDELADETAITALKKKEKPFKFLVMMMVDGAYLGIRLKDSLS